MTKVEIYACVQKAIRLVDAMNASYGRGKYTGFRSAVKYIEEHSLDAYFIIDKEQSTYFDRLRPCEEEINLLRLTMHQTTKDALDISGENISITGNKVDDGINYAVPNGGGLYFVGETHFDPITLQTYYCLKIGKASNLKKRMATYNTCNPMLYRIDYLKNAENLEMLFQGLLKEHALGRCSHNREWFFVDRTTYLDMCAKGFSYFDVV